MPVRAFVLERINVIEQLGSLDCRHLRIVKEADGFIQKIWKRYIVGIQRGHKVSIGPPERVVHIAGFGPFVGRAGYVYAPETGGQRSDFRTVAVIQNVGLMWIAYFSASGQCGAEDVYSLIIRRNENIHGEFVIRRRCRWIMQAPGHKRVQ